MCGQSSDAGNGIMEMLFGVKGESNCQCPVCDDQNWETVGVVNNINSGRCNLLDSRCVNGPLAKLIFLCK
jgi:hypothetical protein